MITVFFGNPGCGKTSLAVKQAYSVLKKFRKLKKKGKKMPMCKLLKKVGYAHIYGNFESSIVKYSDMVGLGQWTFPPYSLVLVDEAGIQYNNRKFKTMPQELIAWFKLHRHYKCDVNFFSQSWDDIDITVRRLADELWYVYKLGVFTVCRKVYKTVLVDDESHQIIDGYKFGKLLPQLLPFPFHRTHFKIFLRFPYYKYFDSWSVPDTPVIE